MSACIKEEPQNSECDIRSAWVEGDEYASLFYHSGQMRIDNVPTNSSMIIFTVRETDSLPTMPVFFELSEGATVTPANGSLQDFSQGPVSYTVTSEDGGWTRMYTVYFREVHSESLQLFSFENVAIEEVGNGSSYNVFYAEWDDDPHYDYWTTGNAGVAIIRPDCPPEGFPTFSTPDGYQGRGVCMNTQLTGELGNAMGKPIAAGNLFLGQFDVSAVLTNALAATRFGIPTNRQPVKVSGWYKYRPGEVFTNASMEEEPQRVDQAHFYAVFYRNTDADGNVVVLNGANVLSSEYIVSKAQIVGPAPTDMWTYFEMKFEGDTADPDILAAMGYNFTIVFSSSKDGDAFEGAVGSTLFIDEVEVEF